MENVILIPKRTPGIYRFYDDKELLYIGKAVDLKRRLTDHMIGRILPEWGPSNFALNLYEEHNIPIPVTMRKVREGFGISKEDYPGPVRSLCQKICEAFMSTLKFSYELVSEKNLERVEKSRIKKLHPVYNVIHNG